MLWISGYYPVFKLLPSIFERPCLQFINSFLRAAGPQHIIVCFTPSFLSWGHTTYILSVNRLLKNEHLATKLGTTNTMSNWAPDGHRPSLGELNQPEVQQAFLERSERCPIQGGPLLSGAHQPSSWFGVSIAVPLAGQDTPVWVPWVQQRLPRKWMLCQDSWNINFFLYLKNISCIILLIIFIGSANFWS